MDEAQPLPARSRTYKTDRKHVFHSWSAQQARDPIVVAGGNGSWFWDENGKRYLDFSSQHVSLNLGHKHPAIVAAIMEQAEQLCTVAPTFAEASRSRAAELIAGHAPPGLDRVFFTNGGADANEHALRMARLATGRPKALAMYRSYHGGTSTALALTGDPRRWAARDTATSGVVHFFGPYLYRSAFHATTETQEGERALAHLADVITLEGPDTIAAIIVEPVVGTNGILVPPPGYLGGVRALCDEHGIVFIADEVMSGFGRCGEWFAVDRWDVVPDLITFAKGVTSGYVPLGGVIINDPIADAFATTPYPGGLTTSGHVLACAVAVANMQALEDEGVLGYVRSAGQQIIGPELHAIAAGHLSVGEVRGLGVFWAIELVRNQRTREPLVPFNASGAAAAPMTELIAAAAAHGLVFFSHFNRLHVVPPCNTSHADLRRGLAIIDDILELADRHVPLQAR